mgnify:CR=1 FL=1
MATEPKYRRIILKVTGEVFAGPLDFGIDGATVRAFAQEIKEVKELGCELALVIGGYCRFVPSCSVYAEATEWYARGAGRLTRARGCGLARSTRGPAPPRARQRAPITPARTPSLGRCLVFAPWSSLAFVDFARQAAGAPLAGESVDAKRAALSPRGSGRAPGATASAPPSRSGTPPTAF